MILLPKISKKWDFLWEVVERKGDWAIMKQFKDEKDVPTYNVIKILQTPDTHIGTNFIPAKEKIPADSQWGIYAWNFGKNLEAARVKFNELTK